MNKTELVKQMATLAGLTQAQAANALDAFCVAVINTLEDDGEVSIVNFGTFKAIRRAERKGRNPKTGEELAIAAHYVPKFSAGKALRDAVK